MKFTELNLPENILRSLTEMGYSDLTPIQEVTYPIVLKGSDLCALAETGSGKTSACAIPLVQKVDIHENTVQGLVIVPTRELCIQYVDEIQKVARHTHVKPFAAYGGFDREIQMAKLRHGVHILVATPGRLKDFIYEGAVDLSNVRCVVLDEADELLREGFFEDIKFLMSCIVHEHQTLMFSATMTEQAKALVHDCLREPEYISLISERATPKSLEHYFFHTSMKHKEQDLVKYLEDEKPKQAIIFCNARHMVDKLCHIMRRHFKNVEYIHAGIDQGKRSSIFRQFKTGDIHYLIATDVAGRGLDFSHITHVINWDFPRGEQYNHRTGRAGRMGRKGKALTFVTSHDIAAFNELIAAAKIEARWIGPVPSLQVSAHSRPGNNFRRKQFSRPHSSPGTHH